MSPERLKAPTGHGAWLAVPPLDQAPVLLAANRLLFSRTTVAVAGRPLADLRAEARDELRNRAARWLQGLGLEPAAADSEPAIMTGHQPTLFHPGVWVKNFVARALGRRAGGTGWNLIVDNDVPKSLGGHVPAGSRDAPVQEFIPFDRPAQGLAYEELSVRDESLFGSFPERLSERLARWGIRPLAADLWSLMPTTGGLVARLTAGRARLERQLDCANAEIPVSEVCRLRAYAWFVADILHRLPEFVVAYNHALAQYRRAHRLRSRRNPMPDLTREADRWETPFWAWTPGAPRAPLYAQWHAGGIRLACQGQEIAAIGCAPSAIEALVRLEEQGWKIRPRAITNTLFARLFLCDLFVHGIGGARYDEVTDQIIRTFYHLEPPAYLTVSATLYLPLQAHPISEAQVRALRHTLRDMHYNPDRHLDSDASADSALAALVAEKRRWIGVQPLAGPERRARFDALHRLNACLRERVQDKVSLARRRLAVLEAQQAANAVLRDREYAYCLFPLEELQACYARVTAAF